MWLTCIPWIMHDVMVLCTWLSCVSWLIKDMIVPMHLGVWTIVLYAYGWCNCHDSSWKLVCNVVTKKIMLIIISIKYFTVWGFFSQVQLLSKSLTFLIALALTSSRMLYQCKCQILHTMSKVGTTCLIKSANTSRSYNRKQTAKYCYQSKHTTKLLQLLPQNF